MVFELIRFLVAGARYASFFPRTVHKVIVSLSLKIKFILFQHPSGNQGGGDKHTPSRIHNVFESTWMFLMQMSSRIPIVYRLVRPGSTCVRRGRGLTWVPRTNKRLMRVSRCKGCLVRSKSRYGILHIVLGVMRL